MSQQEEKPSETPFQCPYYKPPRPATWRDALILPLALVIGIAVSLGLWQVEKWSEPYWLMSSYLAKPITLYSYHGRSEWVDKKAIAQSDEERWQEAYREGFRDGRGICEAMCKRTTGSAMNNLCAPKECGAACAAMRKAGAFDMDAQTPGHACEFECASRWETGQPWPMACMAAVATAADVHDCWIKEESK